MIQYTKLITYLHNIYACYCGRLHLTKVAHQVYIYYLSKFIMLVFIMYAPRVLHARSGSLNVFPFHETCERHLRSWCMHLMLNPDDTPAVWVKTWQWVRGFVFANQLRLITTFALVGRRKTAHSRKESYRNWPVARAWLCVWHRVLRGHSVAWEVAGVMTGEVIRACFL